MKLHLFDLDLFTLFYTVMILHWMVFQQYCLHFALQNHLNIVLLVVFVFHYW